MPLVGAGGGAAGGDAPLDGGAPDGTPGLAPLGAAGAGVGAGAGTTGTAVGGRVVETWIASTRFSIASTRPSSRLNPFPISLTFSLICLSANLLASLSDCNCSFIALSKQNVTFLV